MLAFALILILVPVAFICLLELSHFFFGNNDCMVCFDLSKIKKIETKEGFTRTIKLIRSRVTKKSYAVASGDFEVLSLAGPWYEGMEHTFICRGCNTHIKLSLKKNEDDNFLVALKRTAHV